MCPIIWLSSYQFNSCLGCHFYPYNQDENINFIILNGRIFNLLTNWTYLISLGSLFKYKKKILIIYFSSFD